AVQLTFDVIVAVPDDAASASDSVLVDSVRLLAVTPDCDTLMVRVMPPPVTVTAPVRAAAAVFAVTATASVPLLLPEAGVTVIQVWLSVVVQLTFAVTVTDC